MKVGPVGSKKGSNLDLVVNVKKNKGGFHCHFYVSLHLFLEASRLFVAIGKRWYGLEDVSTVSLMGDEQPKHERTSLYM